MSKPLIVDDEPNNKPAQYHAPGGTQASSVTYYADTLSNELLVARMVSELRQYQCGDLPAIGLTALRRCGDFSETEIDKFGREAMRTLAELRKSERRSKP